MNVTCRIVATLCATCLAAPASGGDIVTNWNATLRQVIQAVPAKANPGTSTRAMAMTNGAIYDIFQASDRQYRPLLFNHKVIGADLEAAVAQAAYRTIAHNYGEQEPFIKQQRDMYLDQVAPSPEQLAGIALGDQVADKYINWRSSDGSELSGTYTPTNAPGHWQSDPFAATPQGAWGPGWGTVQTFAMLDNNQFAVPGVPDMSSPAYTAAYNEVKEKGALAGGTRTAEETAIGLFWAYDRPTMGPPPVLYNQALAEIATQMNNSIAENARLFAMASTALADASVAAWHIKFQDDFWRPVTAIQQGDSDGNPATIGDPNWRPLGSPGDDPNDYTDDFTPPFPAYVSGHATFGGALFETLRNFYGTDSVNFTLSSAEMPAGSETRSFTSFSTAEWENAMSRIYLGIHWRFDAVDGIALGNQIAHYIGETHFLAVPEPVAGLLGIAVWGVLCVRRQRL